MTEGQWGAARNRFCELARLRNQSHGPNFDAAHRHALQGFNALVKEWEIEGVAKDILLPLLESTEPPIRYTAAIFLLRMGATDEALKVLDELDTMGSYIAGVAERYLDSPANGRNKNKESQ